MRSGLRWLMVSAVCLAVTGLTGCKVLSRNDYRRFKESEELAQEYGLRNLALTKDLDKMTGERDQALKEIAQLRGDLGAREQALAIAKKKVADQESLTTSAVETAKVLGQQLDDLRQRNKKLADDLAKKSVAIKGVETFGTAEGYGFRVQGKLLFDSGRAALKKDARSTLDKIVTILKTKKESIRVCGYTDSDPIKRIAYKYKSNYELSGARALAVLNYLALKGIPKGRMHFAGYGEYALANAKGDLIGETGGKEDKSKSRRAEILLLNQPEK